MNGMDIGEDDDSRKRNSDDMGIGDDIEPANKKRKRKRKENDDGVEDQPQEKKRAIPKWMLEIHHLDLKSVGDATIIVAEESISSQKKVVLIDGGKSNRSNIVHNYLADNLNVKKVDVIVVTHYDNDHFGGIVKLLEDYTTDEIYDNAIIYDPGEPPNYRPWKSNGNGSKTYYEKYHEAIGKKTGVTRATTKVNTFYIVKYNDQNEATVPNKDTYLPPNWLVGKEIMWGNGGDGTGKNPKFDSSPPNGAPKITCIAANKWVLQQNKTTKFLSDTDIYNGPDRMEDAAILNKENKNPNPKSLAFLIKFNNFRYYVGGDLEHHQEDGCKNVNVNATIKPFQPGVMQYVNPQKNIRGRVSAMKTSHHGADTASHKKFIDMMRPSAAFISTGQGNQFKHPAQATVNILDGYPASPPLGDKKQHRRHPPKPPSAPYRPVKYYLSGYQNANPSSLETYGGDSSVTAGCPAFKKRGHIILSVTEDQSKVPPEGQIYRGIYAAARAIGADDARSQEIASAGAMYGTAYAVAKAIGAKEDVAKMALEAAATVGSAKISMLKVGLPGTADNELERQIGKGVEAAIRSALDNKNNASTIEKDAKTAHASDDAAKATGEAAEMIWNICKSSSKLLNSNREFAAYGAAAAFGAVNEGATVAQAAIIAVVVGATSYSEGTCFDSKELAELTAKMATKMGIKSPDNAIAGAVAGAAYWIGKPDDAKDATTAAMKAVGKTDGSEIKAGFNAGRGATINDNTQFTVTMNIQKNSKNCGLVTVKHSD